MSGRGGGIQEPRLRIANGRRGLAIPTVGFFGDHLLDHFVGGSVARRSVRSRRVEPVEAGDLPWIMRGRLRERCFGLRLSGAISALPH